jgi:hypothetical protein
LNWEGTSDPYVSIPEAAEKLWGKDLQVELRIQIGFCSGEMMGAVIGSAEPLEVP